MPPSRVLTIATLLGRFLLALVFGLSAAGKLTAPGLFRATVEGYHMLPSALVAPFAVALPWIEALAALYLLLGLFLRVAALATGGLLIVFIVALGVQIARGTVSGGCGCLPTSGPLGSLPAVQWLAGGATISLFDVARDVVFLALAALVVV